LAQAAVKSFASQKDLLLKEVATGLGSFGAGRIFILI
jgi:hypothetical protein